MKNNNALKKHHFWLLFGVVPLFVLIAVFTVSSSVGGKIEAREKEIEAAKSAIASKLNPKPKELLDKAEKLYGVVSSKQETLHKANWDRQKGLYTWPDGSPRLLKKFERANLKFGDALGNDEGEFDEFRKTEVYLYEFSSIKKDGSGAPGTGMADKVAPTQFAGGWQRVLRHVNDFGQNQLNKDQVWLMMEDIWVQRSLLDAVRSINSDVAAFRRAKADAKGEVTVDPTYDDLGNKIVFDGAGKPVVENTKDGPRIKTGPTPDEEKRKALFRSRIWAIELELVRDGGSQRLTGTLTNLSERLQLMGVGNVMTLNVWFQKGPTAQPMVFKIGGEFLPGRGATKRTPDGRDVPANVLPIVPIDDHTVPAAMSAEEIVRVEQVFDVRTVPVKRIDALALGFLDSRNAGKALLPPNSPPFAPLAEAGAAPAGDAGPPGGMGPGGAGVGPVGIGGGAPGGPGGGSNATKPQLWGGGPIASVIDANKKRYLEITAQVRRMPVGIVVVVDQAYMQDMLLAFSNSPLRFQITQVTSTRFRGTLAGTGPSGGAGGPGGDVVGGRGMINFGGSGDPDGPKSGTGPGSIGTPPMGGPGSIGTPPMGGPGSIGTPPMGGPGYPGGATSSTVSETQITSSLVELSIYGIVSLYEKYEAPRPTDGTAATPPAPGPAPAPAPPAPAPPAPGPGPDPMPPAPGPAPKMRRRIRA